MEKPIETFSTEQGSRSSVFRGTNYYIHSGNESSGRKPQLSAPASLSSWGKGRWTDQEKEQDEKSSSGWRKLSESTFGHAPHIGRLILDERLAKNRHWLTNSVVNIFYSTLLSISSTVFVSNPLSGFIILVTMFISESAEKAATLGLVALFFGILSSLWPLGLSLNLIIGGSITFNCFLLGSILLPLASDVGGETTSWQDVVSLIPLAAVVGVFVVYLWSGLNRVLARLDVPVLNSPTNILSLLLVYSGYFPQLHEHGQSQLKSNSTTDALLISLQNNSNALPFNPWSSCNCSYTEQIWNGIIMSQGLIFQVGIPQSYIIYLSVLIYSPILFCQEILGALIGTLVGMGLEGPCGIDICNGSWGYNSLLTCGAVGAIFIRFNLHSFLLSIMGGGLSGFLCAAFKKNGIPVLGLPFMITTWLLVPLAFIFPNEDGSTSATKFSCLDLRRVVEFSTPELNSICRMKLFSRKKYIAQKSSSILHI